MQLEKTKREMGIVRTAWQGLGVRPLPPGSQLAAGSKPYFSPSLPYLLVLERRRLPPRLVIASSCPRVRHCAVEGQFGTFSLMNQHDPRCGHGLDKCVFGAGAFGKGPSEGRFPL